MFNNETGTSKTLNDKKLVNSMQYDIYLFYLSESRIKINPLYFINNL